MSRVDDLLKALAPKGVAYRTLGEVAEFPSARAEASLLDATTYVGVDNLLPDFGGRKDSDYGVNSSGAIRFEPGDVLVGNIRPYLKKVWLADRTGGASPDVLTIRLRPSWREAVAPGFLYSLIATEAFIKYAMQHARGGKMPRGDKAATLAYRVPLPPIEVQHEIVEILDRYATLELQLRNQFKTELDARQSQYAYYRDSLLKFDDADCEWLTLAGVASDFGRGKSRHRPRNDPRLYGGPYPFIQTGDVRRSGHLIREYSQTYSEEGLAQSKLWPRGTVCITIAANIAETGILDFDACFPDSVIGLVVNPDKTSPHYVEYLLQSLKAKLAAKGQGSAQANINLGTFEHEKFPFPSLKEQERIVSVLDKFDALVLDLSSALTAERDARRDQHECYRERVLAFEEAVS